MLMKAKRYHKELGLVDNNGVRREETKHKMNCKADKKLSSVASLFQNTLKEQCEIEEEQFLCRALRFRNCDPLEKILLLYEIENRFAAISYNLLLQTFIKKDELYPYQFIISYNGIICIKSASFISENLDVEKSSVYSQEISKRKTEILKTLNENIIINKIKSLNLLQIVLQYSMESRQWLISIKSMPGSSTWIMIPPMMNLIMPDRREVYSLIELMRMLASSVI